MFFDIGPLELVALVVLAVLVFGPDKLPKVIQDTMAFIRKVREFSDSAKEDIRRELGPEFKDFEFEDLNPKTFIRKNLINGENDEYGLGELKELRNSFDLRKDISEVTDLHKDMAEITDAVNGAKTGVKGSSVASASSGTSESPGSTGSGEADSSGTPDRLKKQGPEDPPPFDADAT
ncbi:sec-independent protein translocase protein TatB [Actinacidiphila yanglinensis]|uniref:Sec-independent protein translocase protein TatB n=1 Tax=Actinacidiphila yanglinensis TaxID=310779 RepID=A0A1H5V748_9ACTN|nr:sec-independent translocase [Actinacidiphila yanglinensis]SEF83024.1 sec-independent protein translocase protein TatB [Actinacidiphila yanglinensis]